MAVGAVTADGRVRVLADGNEMPMLGLGVWQVPDGPECVNAVRWALELGYRHIDTAQAYGNEESVGQGAARERRAARGGLHHDQVLPRAPRTRPPRPSRACGGSASTSVDLYIIHWPQGGPTWAWPGMERARELGHARSIGVSNFSVGELEQVIGRGEHRAGRQPGAVQPVRVPAGAARGVPGAGHRARGLQPARDRPAPGRRDRGGGSRSASGARPRRCCCAGAFSATIVVIPKSTHRERIEENAQIFDFVLSDEDMAELDGLDETGGTGKALERKWW